MPVDSATACDLLPRRYTSVSPLCALYLVMGCSVSNVDEKYRISVLVPSRRRRIYVCVKRGITLCISPWTSMYIIMLHVRARQIPMRNAPDPRVTSESTSTCVDSVSLEDPRPGRRHKLTSWHVLRTDKVPILVVPNNAVYRQ